MPPIEYFGVMIPILGIMLGFFGFWASHKQQMAKLEVEAAKAAAGNGGEQACEIKELRDRVRVLERIVTDGGYDLATQIEALRDERGTAAANEPQLEAERLS